MSPVRPKCMHTSGYFCSGCVVREVMSEGTKEEFLHEIVQPEMACIAEESKVHAVWLF